MKRLSTFAITAAFIFILTGCGVTEADVIASSEDFTVDESTVEAVQEALQDNSESGSSYSSMGTPLITSTTTSMEKDDPTFYYNQKAVSVLDSADQVLEKLGTPDPQSDPNLADHYYSFDSNQIGMQTVDIEKKETPVSITVSEKGVVTSMNIGVGTPKEDVVNAYGNNYETFKSEYGIGYKYDFDKFVLFFTFDNDEVIEYHYTCKEAEEAITKSK